MQSESDLCHTSVSFGTVATDEAGVVLLGGRENEDGKTVNRTALPLEELICTLLPE